MARKSISKEEITPSYDELINELSNNVAKLIIDNSVKTVMIQKLESIINEFMQQSDKRVEQVNNEF